MRICVWFGGFVGVWSVFYRGGCALVVVVVAYVENTTSKKEKRKTRANIALFVALFARLIGFIWLYWFGVVSYIIVVV